MELKETKTQCLKSECLAHHLLTSSDCPLFMKMSFFFAFVCEHMQILQRWGHPCPLNTFLVHALLLSADFYQNPLFQKILSGISSVSNVWIKIRPNALAGLIWVTLPCYGGHLCHVL